MKYLNEKKTKRDPRTGTGKKPKGSGRRLYTDENPKDTVPVKFRTVEDIKKTLNRSDFKSKSHARQSQIINLIHQRARAAYKNAKDPEVKKRLKKSFEYAEKRKEASKEKTKKLNSLKEEIIREFIRESLLLEKKKNKKKKKKVPERYTKGLKGKDLKLYKKLYKMCNPPAGKKKPDICYKYPWPGEKKAAKEMQKKK